HDIAVDPLYSDKESYQAELAALNASDTSKSFMLQQSSNVRTLTKIVDGKGYVFAYNYTNAALPVTFTWKEAPGAVAVFGEGRSAPVSGNAFSDSCGPYEAHVYVIGNGGSGSPPPPPPPPGGGGTPFHGAPIALPGTVEAEDFDEGGEGIAYHDADAQN